MPLVSTIYADAQALLNDVVTDIFTDAILLPFVKMAYGDLQDELDANGLQDTKEYDYTVNLAANTKSLVPPADFISPIKLWEKNQGAADTEYMPITERDWDEAEAATTELRFWQYREFELRFPGATLAKTLKIYYHKYLPAIAGGATNIPIPNSEWYLASRVAAIAALVIGNNPDRSAIYQANANVKLKTLIAKLVKEDQGNPTRRQPFRTR